ncbi:MAG: hypothetical protein MMC33_000756 [Icmadophila ericetorum]|nr:hypothetical protein [Icmadophila ericetorum]
MADALILKNEKLNKEFIKVMPNDEHRTMAMMEVNILVVDQMCKADPNHDILLPVVRENMSEQNVARPSHASKEYNKKLAKLKKNSALMGYLSELSRLSIKAWLSSFKDTDPDQSLDGLVTKPNWEPVYYLLTYQNLLHRVTESVAKGTPDSGLTPMRQNVYRLFTDTKCSRPAIESLLKKLNTRFPQTVTRMNKRIDSEILKSLPNWRSRTPTINALSSSSSSSSRPPSSSRIGSALPASSTTTLRSVPRGIGSVIAAPMGAYNSTSTANAASTAYTASYNRMLSSAFTDLSLGMTPGLAVTGFDAAPWPVYDTSFSTCTTSAYLHQLHACPPSLLPQYCRGGGYQLRGFLQLRRQYRDIAATLTPLRNHPAVVNADNASKLQQLQSKVGSLNGGNVYSSGQHIACVNNICAFYPNVASGTAGNAATYLQNLLNHGCKKCGSDPIDGNNVNNGELTANWVSNP